ncbi:MAG: ABC transporter ATP-binding protein [Anaerolineae bacterium]|nr:ABC transporter ATP-binding protein [Anaerolineae bacterium]
MNIPNLDLKNLYTRNRLLGVWRLLRGFQHLYITATISLGLAAVAKTLTYLLLRYFVDTFLVSGEQTVSPLLIALGFLGLAILESGFTFLSGMLSAQTAEGAARRVRDYIYNHIQHLPFAYHDQMQTGELIQRATSDVEALRRFYADQAIGIGRIIFLFIVNLIAIYRLNATLAWVSVISTPLIIATSIFFFRRVTKAYEAYQEQEAVLSTTLQENLAGVRVVKAFARQQFEIGKFESANWEKYRRGRKLLTIHSLFWPISDTICSLQLLVGYFVAALLTIEGTITVGTYLAYAGLIVWIIFPLRNLGRLIVQTSSGMVSFQRIMDVIRQDTENLSLSDYAPPTSIRGQIDFIDVGFTYPGESQPVLEDITFSCKPGDVIALLGTTGSGKSTLVNLLPRFYDYTSGRILLDWVELSRYPKSYLRQQIGIVEQEPFLFSRSVRENIKFALDHDIPQEQLEWAARSAMIHDSIMSFPDGYDTIVGEKGVTLSGGQKQRVAIARTLLKDPSILILDDSTSAVDLDTEAEIRAALDNLMKNRTTFIIAHRIQSVMNANLIIIMENGRIVQKGTHKELLDQEGLYKKIYHIQTQIEDELDQELTNVG